MGDALNRLYIENLGHEVNETGLSVFFEKIGILVAKITFVKDEHTKKFKGIAFVELELKDDIQKAISCLNGKHLDGRPVALSLA